MTDQNKPVNVHYQSAREKLAGHRASRAWLQELAQAHLLRYQAPIRDEPVEPKS